MASADFNKRALSAEEAGSKVKDLVNPSNTTDQVVSMYSDWVEHYEADQEKNRWKHYETLAEEIKKVVTDTGVKILDIGAGTGLHGIELRRLGYSHIDAVEPSREMMNVAMEKNLYERYIIDFVGTNKLAIDNDTYDVITGAGVFVPGHIKSDSFEELLRIAKPGGLLFIAVSERYYEPEFLGFGEKFDQRIQDLIGKKLWVLESRSLVPGYFGNYKAYINILRKK